MRMDLYKEKAICNWTADSVRLIVTPSQTARQIYFYVQEIGHFHTMPQYCTEREQLSSYLVVYTVSGKGHLKYKGQSYVLLPGQLFFIDCMEYQYYETDPQELWEMLWVHFQGPASQGYYEQFAKKDDPVLTVCSPLEAFTASTHASIPSLLQRLISQHKRKDIRTELLSSLLLTELLTEILLSAYEHPTAEPFLPPLIASLMHEMEQRFQEKLTLTMLAEQFAVSKYYLAKSFKAYTGLSPNEYIINQRITYAKELLKYSDVPVAEIAAKAGIDNVSHFISLFKHREVLTPLAFRRKWQRPREGYIEKKSPLTTKKSGSGAF
jgi:AraC-like DNA-binding protein